MNFSFSDENCPSQERTCVGFERIAEASVHHIIQAEIWFYLDPTQEFCIQNKTFRLIEVIPSSNGNYDTSQEMRETSGWIKFNVKHPIKNWLKVNNPLPFVVDISCTDCQPHNIETSPVIITGANKPILVVSTQIRKRQRQKRDTRTVPLCPSPRTGCCLQEWTFNLTDYPQFNDIVEPRSIQANYCKGECNVIPGKIIFFEHFSKFYEKIYDF